MKHEWRKHEKQIYLPKQIPEIITIPKQKYLIIDGSGNPNTDEFGLRIEALYSIAYTIKMLPKKGYTIDDFIDYTVYPLEGIWSLTNQGIREKKEFDTINKDEFIYSLMIRQPDFISDDIFNIAIDIVKSKKDNIYLNDVRFESIEEGLCVQMLHIGSFDNEYITFNKMKEFINDNQYELKDFKHKEIYLSDFRKVKVDNLKTVLRYSIKKI